MGLFDRIKLIESLPCYSCGSTAETEVGKTHSEGEINLGDSPLKIMRLHDGKGGIKVFQTKNLSCYMAIYYFPGFIPHSATEDDSGYSVGWQPGTPLSLVEICNACETRWEGELHLRPEERDDGYLTDSMEIWPADEDLADIAWRLAPNDFYNLSIKNGRILMEPNIERAIQRHQEETQSYDQRAETYRAFFESIRDPRIPADKLREIFEKAQNNVRSLKKEYANRLANAQEHNEIQESLFLVAEGALKAALIILYKHDREAAMNLIQQSGVCQQREFQRIVKHHEWFFGGEETWHGHSDSASHFLEGLQKATAQPNNPSQP